MHVYEDVHEPFPKITVLRVAALEMWDKRRWDGEHGIKEADTKNFHLLHDDVIYNDQVEWLQLQVV